jgi:hypothetical protein
VDRLIVSEVARQIGARPRDITDAFYQRQLREDICPIVGGRRLIPPDYVPEIERVLIWLGRRVTGGDRNWGTN